MSFRGLQKIFLCLLVVFLVSCTEKPVNAPTMGGTSPTETSATSLPESSENSNYPVAATGSEQNEDMAIQNSYPLTTTTPLFSPEMRGPDFTISEPVRSGDMVVSGVGPANVPIVLVDVTMAGEPLGYATIGADGKFLFNLEKPIEKNHSIGLQLGDISGTDFQPSQFVYNENYIERPFIGVIFDTVNVSE